jgi:DNA-binding LytR/AlgR family response regulator
MNIFNPRILLIYDDEIKALQLDAFLRKEGFQKIIATHAVNEGLIYVGNGHADIILSFPTINGYDVTQRISQNKKLLKTPWVVLTEDDQMKTTLESTQYIVENQLSAVVNYHADKYQIIRTINKILRARILMKSPGLLFVKNKFRKFEKIIVDDILFIEAQISYCNIFTKTGKYTVSGAMSLLLPKLPKHFSKVHEKYAINTHQDIYYQKNHILLEQYTIPISNTFLKKNQKALPPVFLNGNRQITAAV